MPYKVYPSLAGYIYIINGSAIPYINGSLLCIQYTL